MAKRIEMKHCESCNIKIFNVDISTKYCNDCRVLARRNSGRKHWLNNKKLARPVDDYEVNFFNVVKNPCDLTTTGFNTISNIKAQSYTNFHDMSWVDVIKMYGKFNELYDYIKIEYQNYYNNTKKQNIKGFYDSHEYITQNLMEELDLKKLRSDVGVKKYRHTKEELIDNIYELKKVVGGIPIFTEFMVHSKISKQPYVTVFNLPNGKYENIIKSVVTEEEFKEYKQRQQDAKQEAGKLTGSMSAKYDDVDYEDEFKRVFEYCKNEYGKYPTRELFNRLSEIDERNYRKKYNCSWTKVCKIYGYEIERTSNKAEKIVLELISKITNVTYEPQKTFPWLIGVNNFPLFCDGYYENLKLIVEFDGGQHRRPVPHYGGEKSFKNTVANDQVKNKLIPENGLKLLRISSEEEWYDIEYLKNKLIKNGIIPLHN